MKSFAIVVGIGLLFVLDGVAGRVFELEAFKPTPTENDLIDYGTLRITKMKRNQFSFSGDYVVTRNLGNEKLVSDLCSS